ncbi:MAG TPA: sugar phosphate isomerase/epimerase family protein [Candidatus Dormibacteraeota bacterium]|nr:sugar phosphate isomerase/epimerase family protein [Candidatus Dormibacteraeota bacterium]
MRITRRKFVAASACGAASLALRRFAWAAETKERLPLAFSTLGCPAWEWPKILEFAESHGFAAIELRGMMGSMDLPARPEFAPERIAQSKKEIAAHGLKIANIGSSSVLHDADPEKHAQQLADAKRFIDLASALGSPYVRVFGNEIKGPKVEVVARVASSLHELGEYAGPRGVTVILESHGDFVDSPTLKDVLTRADSPHAALLWDAHHTYADGHEQPEYTVHELGSWIRHTHLKDSVPAGKERKYVLTGRGDVPIERQVQALRKIGYKGYFCFEWEKAWHPDLEDPEIALADYAKVVGGYFH